tara:strand:- start:60 stop:326 length:267 start_codon:yes stop_codon:yes gene_type:complete
VIDMTERKMTKKQLEAENEELKSQMQHLITEGQRVAEVAQGLQNQSAQRLVLIRLLESFVNTTNNALVQLQRDLNEVQAPQKQEESED